MTDVAATAQERHLPGVFRTRIRCHFAPIGLLSLLASLPLVSAFREPLYSLDEALLMVYPEQILAGEIPNKDFFTSYGPGGLSILAAVFALVGPAVVAERAVGLIYHLAITIGVYAVTRRLGRFPAVAAGSVAALLLAPLGLLASSWLGALALLTWSLAIFEAADTRTRRALAGALGALAMSWRPEAAVLVAGSAIPYLWRTRTRREWAVGAAIGLAPLGLHTILSGGRLWSNILSRMLVNGNLRPSLEDLDVVAGLLVTLGATTYLAWCAFRHPSRRLIAWAATSVFAVPQMLQRLDLGHALNVAALVVPLALAEALSSAQAARRFETRFGQAQVKWIAWSAAWCVVVLLGAQSATAAERTSPTVTHDSRALPVLHQAEKRAMDRLLTQVDRLVRKDSKVFMGARDMSVPTLNDMRLYHLLPAYDAYAYNLELPPPQESGSLLVEDLQEADALILRDVPRSWGRAMVPFVPQGDDAANDLVDRQFCMAKRVYPYEIYVRCGPDE